LSVSLEKKKIDEYFGSTKSEPITHTPKKSEKLSNENEEEFQVKDNTNIKVVYDMVISDLSNTKISRDDFSKYVIQASAQCFYGMFRKPREYSTLTGIQLKRFEKIVKWLKDKDRVKKLLDTIKAVNAEQKTKLSGKKKKTGVQ